MEYSKEYFELHNKWPQQSDLEKATKRKFNIHSQSIQSVCQKYIAAREAAHAARNLGYGQNKYPYKQKKNYPTKWKKDGLEVHENGKIELSLCICNGKRQKKIVIWCSSLPNNKIKEIELCYDQQLYLAVTFDNGIVEKEYVEGKKAGGDLGEIHTVAAISEDGEAIIVTGRHVRSIHRLRNKKIAEINKLQSRCKRKSNKWKKYQKAKKYILSKSAKQLQDALHKSTNELVKWCLDNSVSDLFIGNPEGVQRNTRKKKKATKKQAQKLSNWSFGEVKRQTKYKLEAHGIKVEFVDEAYTSQTCPVCKKRKKVSSRNYKCTCGYQEHRDVHGARNILSKSTYGEIEHIDVPTRLKYLRIS